jgi:Fe-S-cluster-containing hydrogenase component 2
MEKILLISPEKCIGCGSCETACSFANEGEFRPSMSRIQVFRFDMGINVPMTCLQCEDAPCASVCKTGALVRDEETGVVNIDEDKCIGCRMCVMACPFGNISYSSEKKTSFKCDQCGGDPQCAEFCPTGAIKYVPAVKDSLDKKRAYAAKFATIAEEVEK